MEVPREEEPMRRLITIVLMIGLTSIASCSKYKVIDVEKEKQEATEERIKALEAKLAEAEKAKEEESKDEEKKEEPKVIVVEKKSDNKKADEKKIVQSQQESRESGWVRLYDDKGFTDRRFTVRFGRNIGNMHNVSSDDGKSGFNDKASAAQYSIPDGWEAVLYENDHYTKRGYALRGKGSVPDLGYFSDKCSSLRWEKR